MSSSIHRWLYCAILLLHPLISPMSFAGENKTLTAHPTKPANTSTSATEVVLVGTIHGLHNQARHYSVERLKQIILELKPAAILTELPQTYSGKSTTNGDRIVKWAVEGANIPEIKMVNPIADELHVPVYPFDRADLFDYYKKTHYNERQKKLNEALKAWLSKTSTGMTSPSLDCQVAMQLEEMELGLRSLVFMAEPDVLNSEGMDRMFRLKNNLMLRLIPEMAAKYPELKQWMKDLRFFVNDWDERNQAMADNIRRIAARYPGRRLCVLVGLQHRYMLRSLLMKEKGITLKEYYEVSPGK